MLERWGGQARRGVSVMALRRVAVWPMCLMRPCLTKNVLIHGGNFRITFAAGGRRKDNNGRVRVSLCGSLPRLVGGWGIRSSWELGGWERGGAGAVDWEPFPKHAGVVSFVFFLVITAL